MSGNDMFGMFFQDNQTSGMSHSLDPSLNLSSSDMQSPCVYPKLAFICFSESHVHQMVWYNERLFPFYN